MALLIPNTDDKGLIDEPLLNKPEHSSENEKLEGILAVFKDSNGSVKGIALETVKMAAPITATFVLVYLAGVFGLMFAGHAPGAQHEEEYVLAGVSLGSMFCNVTGFSIFIGLSSAVETLAAQYNGAGEYRRVGHVLQRSLAVLACAALPVAGAWLCAERVLLAWGQAARPARVAGNFVRVRILSLPFEVYNISLEKYLQAQGVVRPAMLSSVFEILVLVSANFVFVVGLRLPYVWLAVSFVLADACSSLMMTLLAFRYPEVQRTFQGLFGPESLKGWRQFFKLGIPGALMICLEWWCFELLVLCAGVLGTNFAAAQAIVYQTIALAYMVPLGLGIATASLIGNALGAGKLALARKIATASYSIIICVQVLIALTIFFGRKLWASAYTQDSVVINIVTGALPITAFFVILDGICCISASVLRGSGHQYLGAIVNFFMYYPFGIPFAIFLAFYMDLKVNGLMWGIGTANGLQSFIFLLYVVFTRWETKKTISVDDRRSTSRTISRSQC